MSLLVLKTAPPLFLCSGKSCANRKILKNVDNREALVVNIFERFHNLNWNDENFYDKKRSNKKGRAHKLPL